MHHSRGFNGNSQQALRRALASSLHGHSWKPVSSSFSFILLLLFPSASPSSHLASPSFSFCFSFLVRLLSRFPVVQSDVIAVFHFYTRNTITTTAATSSLHLAARLTVDTKRHSSAAVIQSDPVPRRRRCRPDVCESGADAPVC